VRPPIINNNVTNVLISKSFANLCTKNLAASININLFQTFRHCNCTHRSTPYYTIKSIYLTIPNFLSKILIHYNVTIRTHLFTIIFIHMHTLLAAAHNSQKEMTEGHPSCSVELGGSDQSQKDMTGPAHSGMSLGFTKIVSKSSHRCPSVRSHRLTRPSCGEYFRLAAGVQAGAPS
jgi:hypothetical protein